MSEDKAGKKSRARFMLGQTYEQLELHYEPERTTRSTLNSYISVQ